MTSLADSENPNRQEEEEEEKEYGLDKHRREVIKNKIRFMGRMARMLKSVQ